MDKPDVEDARKIVFEFPLSQMNIPPVDCLSSKTGFDQTNIVLGCKNGSIYMYQETPERSGNFDFVKISGHELQDGSKIKKVHEICELIDKRYDQKFVIARVTTSKDDEVVLSSFWYRSRKHSD